ncbi:MAG: ACP S-malonyltransferase [Rhodothermales bacterium]|nr:ACP S-malonyltransferase [Rhodothermales bacterium]
MKAYLFPGQGSQFVGMARDLFAEFKEAREVISRADDVLGFAISEIMFADGMSEEESAKALASTDITQPALYVHSMAAWAILKKAGAVPSATAGHSLGEYSALAAAGAISFDDGLRAVRTRGHLMATADSGRPGTMAAVLGLDNDSVDAVCDAASTDDLVVKAANYNSPGQVVISGDVAAVERAIELATEKGAKKVIQLVVGGAFHSPLMESAREGLGDMLDNLDIKTPDCPVYMNVTARPETEPSRIRELLLQQLLSPVKWSQSLEAIKSDGLASFTEVGAGRVLSGLVRRTLGRDVEVAQAGTSADFQSESTT